MTHSCGLIPSSDAIRTIPRIARTDFGAHLLVDGKPFLSLGGELHNSSPSSPADMAPIWERLVGYTVTRVASSRRAGP